MKIETHNAGWEKETEMKVDMEVPGDRHRWESELKVGDSVRVNWGYGLGFRAAGLAVIEKINAKSFVVRLIEDVMYNGGIGWEAGRIIRGIPNMIAWKRWDYEHCVEQA